MRLVAIADPHGTLPEVPPCDVLVIAGDLCPGFGINGRLVSSAFSREHQVEWLATTYTTWERGTPAEHILLVPGNHDWFTADDIEACLPVRSKCLVDDGVRIGDLKFWGSPWTPPFLSWNYMLGDRRRQARLAAIPEGLDVLITHGPPLGICDLTVDGIHAGDPLLIGVAERKQPRVMVFGHIHEGWGPSPYNWKSPAQMWNVSLGLDEPRPPLVLDITPTSIIPVM